MSGSDFPAAPIRYAKIVPLPVAKAENRFLTRKLLPGYEAVMHKRYGGQDSTEIISDMRDGR